MHRVTELSFGKLWCCEFYNHLCECSQGMNWHEESTEGLVLSGKNRINLLKIHSKERQQKVNADFGESFRFFRCEKCSKPGVCCFRCYTQGSF